MQKSIHHHEYERMIALLVAARKEAKLTQAEVAARIDELQKFISNYENCEQRLDLLEYATIARAIGFDWTKALCEYEADYQRRQALDRRIDAELEQTFPASDPLPHRHDFD